MQRAVIVGIGVSSAVFGPRALAQGVLARHPSGAVDCFGAGPDSHDGVTCDSVTGMDGRVCVELPGPVAHCLEPAGGIICISGDGGCDCARSPRPERIPSRAPR